MSFLHLQQTSELIKSTNEQLEKLLEKFDCVKQDTLVCVPIPPGKPALLGANNYNWVDFTTPMPYDSKQEGYFEYTAGGKTYWFPQDYQRYTDLGTPGVYYDSIDNYQAGKRAIWYSDGNTTIIGFGHSGDLASQASGPAFEELTFTNKALTEERNLLTAEVTAQSSHLEAAKGAAEIHYAKVRELGVQLDTQHQIVRVAQEELHAVQITATCQRREIESLKAEIHLKTMSQAAGEQVKSPVGSTRQITSPTAFPTTGLDGALKRA